MKAKLLDAGLQAGDTQGGRAHVDAAAALAKIHGHADDANFLSHLKFRLALSSDW
jgi:hypothetical protein